jgi:hypothetical protein
LTRGISTDGKVAARRLAGGGCWFAKCVAFVAPPTGRPDRQTP